MKYARSPNNPNGASAIRSSRTVARCRAGIVLAIASVFLLGVIAHSTPGAVGADGFLAPGLVASALLTPADLSGRYVRGQQSTSPDSSLVGLGGEYLTPLVNSGVTQADAFFVLLNSPPGGLDEIQITLVGFGSAGDAAAFINYLARTVRGLQTLAPGSATDPPTMVIITSQPGVLEGRVIARQGNIVLGVKATAPPGTSILDSAIAIAMTQRKKIEAAMSGSILSPTPAAAASPAVSAMATSLTPSLAAGTTATPTASATPAASPVVTATPTPLPTVTPAIVPTVVPIVVTPSPPAQPTPTDVIRTDEDPPQPQL